MHTAHACIACCPRQVAFGADGAASKALEGFCRKNGLSKDDVTREVDDKGTEYVWATVQSKGRPAAEAGRPAPSHAPSPRVAQAWLCIGSSGLRLINSNIIILII